MRRNHNVSATQNDLEHVPMVEGQSAGDLLVDNLRLVASLALSGGEAVAVTRVKVPEDDSLIACTNCRSNEIVVLSVRRAAEARHIG